MFRMIVCLLVLCLSMVVGCDKSTEATPEVFYPDGAYLLGLTRNHTLTYLVYDSIVTYFPQYTVTVDTSELSIALTLRGNNRVELAADGAAHDLLTIDSYAVLHTAQIDPTAAPADTIYFYPTPTVMLRTYGIGSSWSGITPPFTADTSAERRSLLFLNYGYRTERSFVGQERIILPTGSFDAYHFDAYLFPDEVTTDTVFTDEYYAPNVGLVKLESRAAGSRRLIILLQDR